MPTILRIAGYRFHFYSNESQEPAHIHVDLGDSDCKFWLSPVALASNHGVAPHDIRRIERIVFENQAFFAEKFYEFHGR